MTVIELLSKLGGRTTCFLSFFTIAGTTLHWLHRLDATYISFTGLIMGFVLGHSVKEDVLKEKG